MCAGWETGSAKGIAASHRLIHAFGCVQGGVLGHPDALLSYTGSLVPLPVCRGHQDGEVGGHVSHPNALLPHTCSLTPSAVCRVGNWVTQMQDGEPVEMDLDATPEPTAAREAQQEKEEDTSVIRETQIGRGGQLRLHALAGLVWLVTGAMKQNLALLLVRQKDERVRPSRGSDIAHQGREHASSTAGSSTGGSLLRYHSTSVGCTVLHDWGTEVGFCSDVGLWHWVVHIIKA